MCELNVEEISAKNVHLSSLFGGGIAGLVVDMVLFPLDTLKTRLQSAQGFRKSGGFNGVYKGIGPQAIGSAPQAALFFLTYESIKYYTEPNIPTSALPVLHMVSASISEIMACLIRVPVEVVKQRRQTTKNTSLKILLHAYKTEGLRKGLYRGFGSTILREVPFSVIQFPILEYLKSTYRVNFKNNIPLESWEVATCGAIAGGFSAAVTTPLDVAKTRIMLADRKMLDDVKSLRVSSQLVSIYREQGIKGLFAGFVPRVLWITLGGYIFFGMYDLSKNFSSDYLLDSTKRAVVNSDIDDKHKTILR